MSTADGDTDIRAAGAALTIADAVIKTGVTREVSAGGEDDIAIREGNAAIDSITDPRQAQGIAIGIGVVG